MLHEQVRLYILNHDNISSFFVYNAHYFSPSSSSISRSAIAIAFGGTDFSYSLGYCCCAGVRKIIFVTRMIIISNRIRLCMFCYLRNFQFVLCIIGFFITSYMMENCTPNLPYLLGLVMGYM